MVKRNNVIRISFCGATREKRDPSALKVTSFKYDVNLTKLAIHYFKVRPRTGPEMDNNRHVPEWNDPTRHRIPRLDTKKILSIFCGEGILTCDLFSYVSKTCQHSVLQRMNNGARPKLLCNTNHKT